MSRDPGVKFWLRVIRFVIKDAPELVAAAFKTIASIMRKHQEFDEDQAWTYLINAGIKYLAMYEEDYDDPETMNLMKLYRVKKILYSRFAGIKTSRQVQEIFGVEQYEEVCAAEGLDPKCFSGEIPEQLIVSQNSSTEAMRMIVDGILSDGKRHLETDIIEHLEKIRAGRRQERRQKQA